MADIQQCGLEKGITIDERSLKIMAELLDKDLYKYCKNGNTQEVANLMRHSHKKLQINVGLPEHSFKTPLHVACQKGHLDSAKILLSYGADVNITVIKGKRVYTPLVFAVENGHTDIVRYLLKERDLDLESNDQLEICVKTLMKYSFGNLEKKIMKRFFRKYVKMKERLEKLEEEKKRMIEEIEKKVEEENEKLKRDLEKEFEKEEALKKEMEMEKDTS